MNRIGFLTALVLLLGLAAVAAAQCTGDGSGPAYGNGFGFVDENGDGYNDLAPDADGDGIPNGLDPDYVRPLDGTGYQFTHGRPIDWFFGWGHGNENGMRYGPGDGTGFGTGPADGTGYGPGGGFGDGICDGTGPHGANAQLRGGRR